MYTPDRELDNEGTGESFEEMEANDKAEQLVKDATYNVWLEEVQARKPNKHKIARAEEVLERCKQIRDKVETKMMRMRTFRADLLDLEPEEDESSY